MDKEKDKYKILCSKNDVVLKRANHSSQSDANANTFVIDFEIANSEITLDRFCNFNIFKLLFELNREDAIQDLRISDTDDTDTKDLLLIFKKKCDDVGIKQKYMKTRLTLSVLENNQTGVANYVFESGGNTSNTSNSSEPAHSHLLSLSGLEELRDIGAVLCMSLLNAHQLRMQFMLSVPISAQKQPSYIENSLALIMKKIFTRLKTFIEAMKPN
jgi:hypothetical protein